MPYTNRPFNPNTPYENQVEIELELANDNFDILRQAFVSNNPETYKVKNADKVDGFDASLTPAPNVIVPLNASGVLDLSTTYIRSNVYTFRRIDLTFATSDYDLQVGEEAVISFNNTTTVALRIRTDFGRLYNIFLQSHQNLSGGLSYLNPNNTAYGSSFSHVSYFFSSGGTGGYVSSGTSFSSFPIYNNSPQCYFTLDTTRRILRGLTGYEAGNINVGVGIFASKWHNNLVSWISLGTLSFPTSFTGYVLVRRLV